MINLTTIQGMYYYINTFKEGAEKYDALQGLKTEINKCRYRNKSGYYVIYADCSPRGPGQGSRHPGACWFSGGS